MKEMDLFLYMFSILATQAVGMLICTGFFAWSAEKNVIFTENK